MCVIQCTHFILQAMRKENITSLSVIWPQGGYDLLEFKGSFSYWYLFAVISSKTTCLTGYDSTAAQKRRDAQHYKLVSTWQMELEVVLTLLISYSSRVNVWVWVISRLPVELNQKVWIRRRVLPQDWGQPIVTHLLRLDTKADHVSQVEVFMSMLMEAWQSSVQMKRASVDLLVRCYAEGKHLHY